MDIQKLRHLFQDSLVLMHTVVNHLTLLTFLKDQHKDLLQLKFFMIKELIPKAILGTYLLIPLSMLYLEVHHLFQTGSQTSRQQRQLTQYGQNVTAKFI